MTGIELTSDALFLVSSSEDATVRLWDLNSLATIATFTADSPIFSVALLRKEHIVLYGSQKGVLYM